MKAGSVGMVWNSYDPKELEVHVLSVVFPSVELRFSERGSSRGRVVLLALLLCFKGYAFVSLAT